MKTEWMHDPAFTAWWNQGGSVEHGRNRATYGEMAAIHCAFVAGVEAYDRWRKENREAIRRSSK